MGFAEDMHRREQQNRQWLKRGEGFWGGERKVKLPKEKRVIQRKELLPAEAARRRREVQEWLRRERLRRRIAAVLAIGLSSGLIWWVFF